MLLFINELAEMNLLKTKTISKQYTWYRGMERGITRVLYSVMVIYFNKAGDGAIALDHLPFC